MNEDAEYWLAVAAQWIQSKSQTQMNFPFHSPFPQVPDPPKISYIDATEVGSNDNLVEADMDIEEDVKEEEEKVEPTQTWANWQPSESRPVQNVQQPRLIDSNTFVPEQHTTKRQSNRTDLFNNSRHVQCPVAPMIGQITESSHSEDMVLDSDEDDNISSVSLMEAQKRKKLPVWIREGLERIEREKKLEEQRLQKEKEHEQDEQNRKKLMEEALKELERDKISKSKYDSESGEDIEQRGDTPETDAITSSSQLNVYDDEDAFEKIMLLVRKTLTEILLEVTDEKIHEISSETLSKFRKKASSVTSNRTVTNSLGLGVYANSDDDDDSDAEDTEKTEDQSDWEPESVLKERIRVKSVAFEHKAKEIKERLARIAEVEQERFSKKNAERSKHDLKYDSDSEKLQKTKNRKNDGEEKYEQIYSVSSSFVSNSRQRDKKKTRFNDPKERTSSILLTHVHVGMMDTSKTASDNGTSTAVFTPLLPVSVKKEKSKKRDVSPSSSSSSSSGRQKKPKKHKKSSKHSKKSSRKRDRSRSRDYDRDKRKTYKSDRRSMESKSSVRSSESRRRSRSRSRSRDRHRSRKY